jgi:hypothetical protein
MSSAGISNLCGKITVLVVFLGMVGLCVDTALALSGSGTQEEPWLIQSLADFDEFAADPNYWDDYTRLETDVNLAGRIYTTAVIAPDINDANLGFQIIPFTGIFDGNDHKITNLTINGGGNNYLGLFGRIAGGEVRNLGLEGGSVNGGEHAIGGLVGATIGEFAEGGIIKNCYFTGDVSVYDSYGDYDHIWVGGLVGCSFFNVISDCYSTGSLSVSDSIGYSYSVGGLVGGNYSGSVSNCYSTSSVSGGMHAVGGLVGINGEFGYYSTIRNCYATGNVSGSYVGGLVGGNLWGIVADCYSTGSVSGDNSGGLVGLNDETISNSYWDIETSGEPNMCGYQRYGTGCDPNYGKTTAEMKKQSTFQDWDFIDTWNIGENQTYPYLRSYPAGDINKDGIVNFRDLAFMALQWLEVYNLGNQPPEVLITYPEDGDRLMVGGIPPQTLIHAQADDNDGTVVRVEFFDGGLKLGDDTDGSDGWNYLWQDCSLGFHVLTATAWDNEGLSATSPPVNVEVWMPDPPPP